MSNNDRPPPQPPTVKLPAMTDRALLEDLTRVVKGGFERLTIDVDVLIEDGRRTNQRLTRVEERIDELDGRLMRSSSRVKSVSENDLAQEAQLAQERAAREALATEVNTVKVDVTRLTFSQAKQTEMISQVRDAVVGVVTNKKLIFVGKVLFGLAVAYSAAHGLKVLP